MISEIHDQISKEFSKLKLPQYTTHLNLLDMMNWSEEIAIKHNLDIDIFEMYVKELFWGLASIQMSLGYGLIALNETEHPSGKKGTTSIEKNIPNIGLADIHFWHHLHNTWESIYRFWERAVSVLEERLTPSMKNKLYFDGLLNELKNIESLSKQEDILPLYDFNKAWNKITKMRNRVSHEKSNPCSYFNIEVENSSIIGDRNEPIPKYNYESPNLKQEINTVINSYKKSFSLFNTVIKVCNSNITPNILVR